MDEDRPAAKPASDQGESRPAPSGEPEAPQALRERVVEALKSVYDPEIPVDIYELGLIYGLDVDADGNVAIKMTLTAPACPAAGYLPMEVESRVRSVPGVKDVKVEIVWDPPWTKERMSEAAKLQLGLLD